MRLNKSSDLNNQSTSFSGNSFFEMSLTSLDITDVDTVWTSGDKRDFEKKIIIRNMVEIA